MASPWKHVIIYCLTLTISAVISAPVLAQQLPRVEIEMPRGANGMQPSLALVYDPNGGNGIVGLRWALSGLPDIRRVNYGEGIQYNGADTYAHSVDGVLIMQPDRTYRTKSETFARYQWGEGLCGDGPCGWIVTDRSGVKYFFGLTSNSRLEGNKGSVRRWALEKVQDLFGNFYTIEYTRDPTGGYFEPNLYPKTIQYTMGPGLVSVRTVEFEYDVLRPDTEINYRDSIWERTIGRIRNIYVRSDGAQIRRYELDYDTPSTALDRSWLSRVVEHGADDTALPYHSTFTWNHASRFTFGFNYTEPEIFGPDYGPDGLSAPMVALDLDRNGKTDLCRVSKIGIQCLRSSGVGDAWDKFAVVQPFQGQWQDFVDAEDTPVIVGDWDGDGRMDLCEVSYAGIVCARSTGDVNDGMTGFAPITDEAFTSFLGTQNYNPTFAIDVNGDGRTDICRFIPGTNPDNTHLPKLLCYLSTGNGWKKYRDYFIDLRGVDYPFPGDPLSFDYPDAGSFPFIIGDWNGDGRMDVCFTLRDRLQCVVSTASGWSDYGEYASLGADISGGGGNSPLIAADFNADGKADFCKVINAAGVFQIWVSTGNGFTTVVQTADFTTSQGFADSTQHPIFAADVNGDGKMDLCRVKDAGLWCYYAPDFWVKEFTSELSQREYGDANVSPIVVGDVDGDGKSDICRATKQGVSCLRASSASADEVVEYSNGLGATYNLEYLPLPQVVGAVVPDSSGRGVPLTAPVQLVTQVSTNGGTSDVAKNYLITKYEYEDARMVLGRPNIYRFLGFAATSVINVNTGQTVRTEYYQDLGVEGKPKHIRTYGISQEGSEVTISYWTISPSYGTEYAAEEMRTTYFWNKYAEAVTRLTSKPDIYGRQSNWTEIAKDRAGLTVFREYEPADTSNWILERVNREYAEDELGMPLYEAFYTWDGNELRNRRDLIEDAETREYRYVVTTYQYDQNGNLQTVTEPPIGDNLDRTTTTIFDSKFHAMPQTVTDPLNHYLETWYDPAGHVTDVWDENRNHTHTEYDTFGRARLITRPDGGTTAIDYEDYGTRSLQHKKTTTKMETGKTGPYRSGQFYVKKEYFDGYGFVYLVSETGDDGRDVCSWTMKDVANRPWRRSVKSQSCWFGDPGTPYTETNYDDLGRVVGIRTPDTQLTRVDYESHASYYDVTNPLGNTIRYTIDSRGKIVTVLDAAQGTTHYSYDSLGRPTYVVLPNGQQTKVTYDLRGLKHSVDVPHVGLTTYEYYDNGTLHRISNHGSITIAALDALNRPLKKERTGERSIEYGYDDPTVANGKGRMTSISDDSGTATFAYDAFGRVTTLHRSIDNTDYTTTTGYDMGGRLRDVYYPDGSHVKYSYTNGNHLEAVMLNKTLIATWSDYLPSGQAQKLNLGNGVGSTYGYDVMGHITSLDTRSTVSELQNLTYDWYGTPGYNQTNGMALAAIADHRADTVSGGVNTDETEAYGYDELNRLRWADRSWSRKEFEEDTIGNLLRLGGTEDREFRYLGQQPVWCSVCNELKYDNVGNLSSKTLSDGIAWKYGWSIENRLTSIERNGQTVGKLAYSDDGHRVKKEYESSQGVTITTTYIGDLYEKRTYSDKTLDRHTVHIFGNGQRIASITKEGTITTASASGLAWRNVVASAAMYSTRDPRGAALRWLTVVKGWCLHPLAVHVVVLALFSVFGACVVVAFFSSVSDPSRFGLRFRGAALSMLLVFGFGACAAPPTASGMQLGLLSAPLSGDTTAGPSIGTLFYHPNHINATSVVTDGSGTEVSRMLYHPFGELDVDHSTGVDAVTAKFTGQESDEEFGLLYYNARYYDPSTGRFLSADPVIPDPSDGQAFNRYSYVRNNPINLIDPSGYSWSSFWRGVGNWLSGAGRWVVGGLAIAAGVVLCVVGASYIGASLVVAGVGWGKYGSITFGGSTGSSVSGGYTGSTTIDTGGGGGGDGGYAGGGSDGGYGGGDGGLPYGGEVSTTYSPPGYGNGPPGPATPWSPPTVSSTRLEFDTKNGTLHVTTSGGRYDMGATSGRGQSMNRPADSGLSSTGPIPAGWYTVDVSQLSNPGRVGDILRNFRGDWGDWRVPLIPDAGTNTFGRSGFFLHGGSLPGSAGCIDIGGGWFGNAATDRLFWDLYLADPWRGVPLFVY